MPVTRATWPIAVVLLAACGPRAPSATDSQQSPPAPGAAVAQSAQIAGASGSLSPQPPFDIPPNAAQAQVATYAWQQFVALNWPAASGQRGMPDTTKTIGQPGTVVWHTWKTPDEIFYPAGETPPPWNQYGGQLPPQCVSAGVTSTSFVLQRTSKAPADLDNAAIQLAREAVGGTLTDQHGNLARFEVRLNQTIFNDIITRQLYSVEGQAKATVVNFQPGVMEVKAAWRQMTAADPPSARSRYYTESAWIYTPAFGTNPATCVQGVVGTSSVT